MGASRSDPRPRSLTVPMHLVVRVVTVAAACAAALAAGAAPASAHPLHYGDDATNWKSTITGVEPSGAVGASLGDATQRLTISLRAPATVIVKGYQDEPFVMLRTTGAWVNTRSTTTYDTANRQEPATADNLAAPMWRQVSHTGSWTWHDQRTHWPGYALPPPVEAKPNMQQRVLTWSVPLDVNGRPGSISGSLTWVPGPSGASGALFAGLAFLGVAATAVVRRWHAALAGAVTGLVGVDIAHSIGMVSGRVGGLGTKLAALPGHGVLPLLLWISAAVGIVVVRRGHEAGLYVLAVTGTLICFVDGLPSLAVLWHSQFVNALPPVADRLLVAILTGGGAGLLGAAMLRLSAVLEKWPLLDKWRLVDKWRNA